MASEPKKSAGDESRGGGRRRRARGSLTPELILDAAERIAAEQGYPAVTMRAVAAESGAAPMALYRHFPSKDELVNAMLDRVLGRFEPAPATDDWTADLGSFALAHRRLLDQHPWALQALFTHPSPGINATRIGEVALTIIDRGGFSDDHAVAIFSGLLALNYGWVSFTAERNAEVDVAAGLAEALAALPPAMFPRTLAVAPDMAAYGSDEHYEFVLGYTLAGIRVAAPGSRAASRGGTS